MDKKKLITICSIIVIIIGIVIALLIGNKKTITYKISFKTDGGSSVESQTVIEGEKAIKPVDPIKEGYEFVEWMNQDKTYDFDNEVTSNLTLIAKWNKIEGKLETFVVKFDTDGGTAISNQIVTKGNKVQKPMDPVKKGYIFKEWILNNKTYDFTTIIDADIELKAKWEEEQEQKHTVTFKDGNTIIKTVTLEENKTVEKPKNPTKSGYKFVKWQLEGKDYNFSTRVTKNITLKAVWEKIVTYTVKFDTAGGSSISSKTVEENKTVAKPTNPTKSGYVFVKWQLEGKDYNFSTRVTKNITLKAVWEKIVTYTVKFDTAGGSSISSKTVEENKTVAKPTNPTKSGYVFVKWQLEGKDYNFSTKVTKNITLKAVWRELKKYTVTFKDGDKTISTKTVNEGTKVTKPTNPTKTGYTFSGWLLNGKSYDFSKTVTGNITLTASWKQKSYTVTVTLVDSETNPARKLVVKQGTTVINDAKAIKTTDGVVLDNSAPFTINTTVVNKLGSSVKVVLKDGTEVTATLIK